MEALQLDTIAQLVGSLGTGGLFVYLYFRERAESQKAIQAKDSELKELNGKLLEAFQDSASASVRLSQSIKDNTKASRTLVDRVTSVLINGS